VVLPRHNVRGLSVVKPVILAVDDDRQVLATVRRDLLAKYSEDYRVVGAYSAEEALEILNDLALKEEPVALMLVDQRMPQITGIDLLKRSHDLFPDSMKALLTAYADTDAAISAINEVQLDYYIMKPWDPPEELLYPILDDLLDDWAATYRPRFSGVRLIGQRWSRDMYHLKSFLTSNQVSYRSLDIESDDEARALLESAGKTLEDLPVALLTDGTAISKPTGSDLAGRLGLHTAATEEAYDLVIVGAGPSGLAAAVYGSSEGLRTLLVEGTAPGGQAGQSSRIENYLGFPKGLSGSDLARRAVTQAKRFGTEILVPAEVDRVTRKDPFHVIHLSNGSDVTTKAVLISSGVSYRKLDRPGVEELSGVGVYYGTSQFEANQHAGEPVYIVGAGNSAGQGALFVAGFTDSVTIFIRGDDLTASMSQYLIDLIEADERITVRPRTQLMEARGEKRLESLLLDTDGTEEEVKAGALFIFIGQAPRTDWIADLVETDERGFILTGSDIDSLQGWTADRDPLPMETSVPGIFAAGDVRHGSTKRVATSTGEGATAVRFIHEHLADL
jgi:thioredoxin reductase (NADPH)